MDTDKVLKEGLRYNTGKLRFGLLSIPALWEIVKVLEFGAKKYAAWNWTKGLSWADCYNSFQRHANAWYMGEDNDPETGLSHMAHILCNAMFLMHFILFKTGRDDRPVELRGDKQFERTNNEPAPERVVHGISQPLLWVDPNSVVERGIPDVQADVFPEAQ